MGRKKIEIRPLVDERNRNVTFLKRKAGLMKKAWELSVLCGADVSIVIFSAAGKAYEFSSRDLDGEIDRYLEYEGLIERRRAEEFAAMAEAGEDDDDDDEDYGTRRASTSKGGPNGIAASGGVNGVKPTRSLKGRESYKARMPGLREMSASGSDSKKRKRDREREREERPQQGFIQGLLTDSEGERDDDDGSRDGSDLAGLKYAMSLGPGSAPAPSQSLASFPTGLPFQTPSSNYRSTSLHSGHALGPPSASPAPLKTDLIPSYASSAYPQPMQMPMPIQMQLHDQLPHAPSSYPPTMGGLQWDPALLQRYAEFQLQQNHQKQHRALLERQREQLALMGVGVGGEAERRVMDDIFGVGGASGSNVRAEGQGNTGHTNGSTTHGSGGEGEFIWPTFGSAQSQQQQQQPQRSQSEHQYLPRQSLPHQQGQAQPSSNSVTPDAGSGRQVSYDEYYRHAHIPPAPQHQQSQPQVVVRRDTYDDEQAAPMQNNAWFADLKPDITHAHGGAPVYSEPLSNGDVMGPGEVGGAEYADDGRRYRGIEEAHGGLQEGGMAGAPFERSTATRRSGPR